ncbi:unnamed protein product, partial [Prorocentrum cordatum]
SGGKSALDAAKRHGRMCIVVHWAHSQIIGHKPEKKSDLKNLAMKVREQLAKKGIGDGK